MVKKFHCTCCLVSSLLLSAAMNQAYAENVGGSGAPIILLKVTTDQRAILSLAEGNTLAIGSANLDNGYAQLPLDAFDAQSTQSDWGKAEVLLGCGVADVLIYQQQNGEWVEVMAQQLGVEACVQ